MTTYQYIRKYTILNTVVLLVVSLVFYAIGEPVTLEGLNTLVWVMIFWTAVVGGFTKNPETYVKTTADTATWAMIGFVMACFSVFLST
jgi:hypothetical protein